jgi:hypothetical protein
MKQTTMRRVARTQDEAHVSAIALYEHAKTLLGLGHEVELTVGEHHDPKTLKQLRFIHGPVLKQIAEQAVVNGQRWSMEAWKILLKQMFLGYEFVEVATPLVLDRETGEWRKPKRKVKPKVLKTLRSLRDLDVREGAEFIDKVIAFATTDLGVVFHFIAFEREEVRYREPVRKAKPRLEEAAA